MRQSLTETSAITSPTNESSIGVFKTPRGYLIQTRDARIFLSKTEFEKLIPDLLEAISSEINRQA